MLAQRLEAATVSMTQDMAAFVRERQQAGTWSGASADVLAQVILSILPGFLLNLALLGGPAVARFPDAVRTLWPS